VDTRVRQVHSGEYHAIILAAAGLLRLGLEPDISERFPIQQIVPAPGQGALAIQCRADDRATRECLAMLDDRPTRVATEAERGFLEGLGGGCLAPIAAHGAVVGAVLTLTGVVASADGREQIRVTHRGPAGEGRDAGIRLADQALARGAGALLA
jgi:hydroxymethylbilane synthase